MKDKSALKPAAVRRRKSANAALQKMETNLLQTDNQIFTSDPCYC